MMTVAHSFLTIFIKECRFLCRKNSNFAIEMLKNRMQNIVRMLAALVVSTLLLWSCGGRKEMSNHVIVQNDTFIMTGDSIIEDTVFAIAVKPDHIENNITLDRLDSLYSHVDTQRVQFVQGRPWHKRQQHPSMMPEYHSEQPLVDALYNMSAERIVDAIDGHGCFNGSHNISRLYCSIYLSLAALKPHQSMATLRTLVDRDSIIMQREGQWPVVSDHIGWATAAWEVYKTTGDREWLAYSKHVIEKTLSINSKVLVDHNTGLTHGAGYTTSRPLGVRRMTWMGYNDLFACMSLGNNILTAHAWAILGDMCDELGIENNYEQEALHLKDAINQYLWNEDKAFYSSFLYGMAIPHQSPTTDNTSQAMSVLWGIADDERAENLIAHTPVSDYGVNVTYPANNPLEPYFANPSWATTQALWNLAAAWVGNENALRRGLGALYRAGALYQSRGIHMKGLVMDELGAGASNAAMILRILLGMDFKSDGIDFSPMIPVGMPGTKTLKGLNYRKAVLDFTIKGTGNKVVSITDNGNPLESTFLPGNIEGHHHIVINVQQGNRKNQIVTIHNNEAVLPLTPTVIWAGDTGHIVDYVADGSYYLSINGELSQLHDSVFVLPETDRYTEFSVVMSGRHGYGFMSKPLFRFGLTPQMAFFPEVTEPDDDVSITVRVARGGDYLLDVGYLPTGTLDVRRVIANDHPMGTLVMARGNQLAQEDIAYSNMVVVKLLKGENHIGFHQIKLPKSFTRCAPVHVRIISFE